MLSLRIFIIACLVLFSTTGFTHTFAFEIVELEDKEVITLVAGEIEATPVKSKGGFISRWRESRMFKDAEENPDYDPTAGGPQSGKFEEQYKSMPADLRQFKFKHIDRKDDQVLGMAEQAIEVTAQRAMTANMHTPWQIFHGVLALRHQLMMNVGNKRMTAIEWLSTANPIYNGEYLFEKTSFGGRTHKFTDPYIFEGHPYQFLGIITMSDLPLDHKFASRNGHVTIQDLINGAKWEVNSHEEITWQLWFLAHYLKPDEEWTNSRGEHWNIEKMVRLQTQADVLRGACGGCHGLFAIAFARNNYLKKTNEPLRGVWIDGEQKLQRYISMAQSIQRTDGSFPTKYFKGYGDPTEYSEYLASSGHMMEWLMIALPDERLKEPWVRKGIENLAKRIISFRNVQMDCGPLYHALDALVIFRDRMNKMNSQGAQPPAKMEVVQQPKVEEVPVTEPPKTAMAEPKSGSATITDSNTGNMKPAIVPENKVAVNPEESNHPLVNKESSMPILKPDQQGTVPSTAMGDKEAKGISADKNTNDVLNSATVKKQISPVNVDPNDPFQMPREVDDIKTTDNSIKSPKKSGKDEQFKDIISALSVPPTQSGTEIKSSLGWKKAEKHAISDKSVNAEQSLEMNTDSNEQWTSKKPAIEKKQDEEPVIKPAEKKAYSEKKEEVSTAKPETKKESDDEFELPVPVGQEPMEDSTEGEAAPEIKD